MGDRTKGNGGQPEGLTAVKGATTGLHSTSLAHSLNLQKPEIDLQSWASLGKESRQRPTKRIWRRVRK